MRERIRFFRGRQRLSGRIWWQAKKQFGRWCRGSTVSSSARDPYHLTTYLVAPFFLTCWLVCSTSYLLCSVCLLSKFWAWDWFFKVSALLELSLISLVESRCSICTLSTMVFSMPSPTVVWILSRTATVWCRTDTHGNNVLYEIASTVWFQGLIRARRGFFQ